MIAFEVKVNGKRACVAGIPGGHGVLHAIVTWVKRKPGQRRAPDEELRLDIGGLDSTARSDGEFVDWLDRPLKAGDNVAIRVLNAGTVDPPVRRRPTFTSEEIEGQKAKSYRSSLAEARAQRRGIDRRIARLEREPGVCASQRVSGSSTLAGSIAGVMGLTP